LAQLNQSTVATYSYNDDGERIAKTANGAAERYNYGEDSQLLSEYGSTSREYVYLDDIPVANLDTQGTTTSVAYVTADQLGTPRAITDANSNTVWTWAYPGNPWGEQQPTSNGYVYNLRFPGQYFDAETGLHYNINRDYDPNSGRYVESDPLGLLAGSSTYAYVHSNPGIYVDSDGRLDTSGPLGQALKRAGVIDMAGGGPEDLIGDILAVGVGGYSLADEIAKKANHEEVHRICDEPPPTNLNDCELARWKLTKALRCKAVRQKMTDKWFGGIYDKGHSDRMDELDREIDRYRRTIDRVCKPCDKH